MKRSGLILAALLFVGSILRIGVPAPASSSGKQETASVATTKKLHTVANTLPPQAKPRTAYEAELELVIRESFGTAEPEEGTSGSNLSNYWGVPQRARLRSMHVIAILPDPIHTQLALFFDRGIESLQIAAQRQGYEFDRAILPWERESHPESPDLSIREKTELARKIREESPGLLIFRESINRRRDRIDTALKALPNNLSAQQREEASRVIREQDAPLFVWVVGESPTSGIRKLQFEHARALISEIRPPDASAPLLILGPTFSGSLDSLRFELSKNPAALCFIYSGTVTGSMATQFAENLPVHGQFTSFSENDDYLIAQFLEFAHSRGYQPDEVAVISEDETAYGNIASPGMDGKQDDSSKGISAGKVCLWPFCTKPLTAADYNNVVHLHFPREISQFRAAYQRQAASSPAKSNAPPSPGISTLPLDLGETGNNDDTVAPYAPSQSTLSQEAVMLGIVSSLRKHHSKFVVLFATDPLDEIFLARYFRASYPQGRIVITTPDLLAAREEDSLLQGVIGINTYPLLPGLNDRLAKIEDAPPSSHEDRLFVSSLSEGTFNAMVGLLSAGTLPSDQWPKFCRKNSPVPVAPYADYASPVTVEKKDGNVYPLRPLLWLTYLGRDGFWPIVGVTSEKVPDLDAELPVTSFDSDGSKTSLRAIDAHSVGADPVPMRTPGAWRVSYVICLLIMILHVYFSTKGTILSDSEAMAQFAKATPPSHAKKEGENRGAIILAAGALCLVAAFGLVMSTRTLHGLWRGGTPWALALWLPLPLFTFATAWDLANWRHSRSGAYAFAGAAVVLTSIQILLATAPFEFLKYHRVFWSTRVLHFGSGVSPVLPVLLLAAAFYWWFWMSLRGISLVDLRRPRLPEPQELPADFFRISDKDAETLRQTAYPLSVSLWQTAPLVVLAASALTLLDLKHPVQTIEGRAYDWGFTVVLGILTWIFLATLLKLVRTWLETRQILAGLDRKAIREAFSRLKGFSWKPMWNPGGSTLRESYRVLSRALENLERLHNELHSGNCGQCLAMGDPIHGGILDAFKKRDDIQKAYREITGADSKKSGGESMKKTNRFRSFFTHDANLQKKLDTVLLGMEELQRVIARVAAALMRELLADVWSHSPLLVASKDPRKEKSQPSLVFLLAEEYVALVYVNFLVSALLRMRTLVYSAVGMYVLLLCAVSVYPFEPHPAIQGASVVALLVLGFAVGYVYSQMHRDVILSRLTETGAGELGWDFWLKFASAGAIPVLSLLAAQFPAVNQILFSWLEPALEALK